LLLSATFTRTDTTTDSEYFYNSILQVLEDPDKQEKVKALLIWWNRYGCIYLNTLVQTDFINRQVFPAYSSAQYLVIKKSALANI
jgi:hypothetical protein